MSLAPIPTDRMIDRDRKSELNPVWLQWFTSIQFWLFPNGNFGTTTNRPTTNLYIGRMYFDTTKGFPVWIQSLGPTVWVRYDGTAV